MSKSRPFSRPRTRVYDSNYNIGESLYKSALDGLDRKYGRPYGVPDRDPFANGDIYAMRGPPPPVERPAEVPPPPLQPRSALRELEDEEFFADAGRRRPASALLGEFDSIFESRMRNGLAQERSPLRAGRTIEDEIDEGLSSATMRMKAIKATRSLADEFEDMELAPRKERRAKLDFSEKVMDSVGLTGRARANLEEEGSTIGRRRYLKMTTSATDMGEGDEMAKWTALKSTAGRRQLIDAEEETSVTQSAAAARARKSRARLEDLESEMQALSERSAARDKRVRDLKALVQENEASALDNLQSTVRVKSSIQSEKKMVSF